MLNERLMNEYLRNEYWVSTSADIVNKRSTAAGTAQEVGLARPPLGAGGGTPRKAVFGSGERNPTLVKKAVFRS